MANFGFVSTRFSGSDGVSLESAKWAEVLWADQHVSFWYSGLSDRLPEISSCIPEAYFHHSENRWINERIWGRSTRDLYVTERIRVMSDYLKQTLREFVEKFSIDVLVPENSLTIPMHVPLGIAITEFLAESGMPAIAHHHDFYWERSRFSRSGISDYLDMAFPPRLPNLAHTVINAAAQQQLSFRKGVGSSLIPNVFDFETEPPPLDNYVKDLRKELGLSKDDIFVLQPTRVVPRKGIEHAIKLIAMLDEPRCKLVVSHDAGDEGLDYQHRLVELARDEGVDIRFVGDRVADVRQRDADGRKLYTLWDLYPHADLVTYPSTYEGFGNALLEAIYYRKPVVINRYGIYIEDIEPKGFRFAAIDNFVTANVVNQVRRLIADSAHRQEVVDHNYQVASQFYGYPALRQSLRGIVTGLGIVNPP